MSDCRVGLLVSVALWRTAGNVNNIIELMSSSHSQNTPSSPIYFAYTYTAGKRSDLEDDKRSMASSCYSSNSIWSAAQSQGTSQRLNELKPKSKILISKCSTLANTKKQSQTQSESPSKISIASTPISRRSASIITESIEYSTIKPFFNWNKFSFLCGMGVEKLGESGCLCGENCLWKKEWSSGNQKTDVRAFEKLLREKGKEEYLTQIEKDLPRTHPQCPTFSQNPHFRQMLRKVLVAYSIYDMEMGYVQGVNMIAGVLLYHIKNESLTFWALVEMMEYQELRMVYLHGFEYLRTHCQAIDDLLHSKVHDLHSHMQELQINSDCFLNGWLLSLMSTAIPMEYMHGVLDQFRRKGWKYIYQLIITYLLFLKELLLTSRDQAEFLMSLNVQSSRQLGVQWAQMIQSATRLSI